MEMIGSLVGLIGGIADKYQKFAYKKFKPADKLRNFAEKWSNSAERQHQDHSDETWHEGNRKR
jgi:hypothetical protein